MNNIALFHIDGLLFILKWLHVFFAMLWVGHLYYFNFTQAPFMAEADAATKLGVQTKLLPIALWWFRWGAMWTLVTGLLYLMIQGHLTKGAAFGTSWGVLILIGSLFGMTMWYNVWFVIWPKQKIVIESANQVVKGGAALTTAAPAAAAAMLASRTNTLFSLPVLFFMLGAQHLPVAVRPESRLGLLAIIVFVLWGALEFNALKGKLGPLKSVVGVVHMGVILTVALYVVVEACL